jgi:hypothetical protein
MNYATSKLTASLQSLTRQSQQKGGSVRPALPKAIRASQFTVSKGVESFLKKRSEYTAKSMTVRIGSY